MNKSNGNPICDLSNMNEDKKYIVKFENSDKMELLEVLEKTSNAIYFTNGMINDLDGIDISVFADGNHNIVSFTEYKD